MTWRRFGVLAVGGGLVAGTAALGGDAASAAGWEMLERFDHRSAARVLRDGTSREAQLGHALAELNSPPHTPRRVAEAEERLRALAGAIPADLVAHAARYHLAMVALWHREPRDVETGLRELRAVAATAEAGVFAQLAFVHAAVLDASAPGLSPAQRAERVPSVEAVGAAVPDPRWRRAAHIAFAELGARWEISPAVVFDHLWAARKLGLAAVPQGANTRYQLARFAEEIGPPERAVALYREFLAAYPRDVRGFDVRRRLARLGAAADPEGEG